MRVLITLFCLLMLQNAWAQNDLQFVPGFEDIPLMPDMEVDEEGQVLFDTTSGRIAEINVATTHPRQAVKKYYHDTLTQLGWHALDDFKFRREKEKLQLNLSEGKDKSNQHMLLVEFELSPISNEQRLGIMSYKNIIVETKGRIQIIRLNRPEAMNALSTNLIKDLNTALDIFESDDSLAVLILTGSEKVFAAGADIKEMKDKTFPGAYKEDFITSTWERLAQCRKPIIAAVAGYALGGGCEIAMMCDMIYAADNAKFSQPEITIGTMPGAGGTQRLTRLVGPSLAMEMCLTGTMIDATHALNAGLVARVFPVDELQKEVEKIAEKIAEKSLPVLMMIKESIRKSQEMPLREGLMFERRLFHSTFALHDRQEGMEAFLSKRKPHFTHE
jgi:enoyl-CoA hydratase